MSVGECNLNRQIKEKARLLHYQQDVTVIRDSFGREGSHSEVDIGWLTTQLEIRLSFLKNPIRWWKKRHQAQNYTMKVSATDPKVFLSTTELNNSVEDYNSSMVGVVCHVVIHVSSFVCPQIEMWDYFQTF